jgi:hypothetical protein
LKALCSGIFDVPPFHGAIEQMFKAHHLFTNRARAYLSYAVGLPSVNILGSYLTELEIAKTGQDVITQDRTGSPFFMPT